MLWWVGLALAAPRAAPDPMLAVIAAWEAANAGDDTKAVAMFGEVLAADPTVLDAAVGRGLALFALGRTDEARADLASAFSSETWTRTKVTTQNFIEIDTTITSLDLVEQRRIAAATLAVLDARAGDAEAAGVWLTLADKVFGDAVVLRAAHARVDLAAHRNAAAWVELRAALEERDPTGFTTSVASEMVSIDPNGAPPEVYAALERAGQWTAAYNRAAGQMRIGHYGPCLVAAKAALQTWPGEGALLGLAYRCAARSDPMAAEAFLLSLGGVSRVPLSDAVAHADALVAAGRPDQALTLLRGLKARAEADRSRVADAIIRAALAKGDLDSALAATPDATAAMGLQVAFRLVDAARIDDADVLVRRLCPMLVNSPEATSCHDLGAWLKSRP